MPKKFEPTIGTLPYYNLQVQFAEHYELSSNLKQVATYSVVHFYNKEIVESRKNRLSIGPIKN